MKAMSKYKNSVFYRLILSYTLMTVILISLAGGYLYSRANELMIEEISKDSQQRLQAVKDYMENTMLSRFENHVQNISMSTGFASNSVNLNYLLDNSWQNNLSRIALFSKGMELYALTSEGVHNTTVYLINGNYAIDKTSFYMEPENSTDYAFIEQLNPDYHDRWITRQLSDGQQVLTYVLKLPYNQPSAKPKGYIYIDVTVDHLRESISQIVTSPHEKLYIFSKQEEIILTTGEVEQGDEEQVRKALASSAASDGVHTMTQGNAVFSHLNAQYSGLDWSYAVMRPINTFSLSSERFKSNIFVICGIVLVLGFVISYLFSKQFYMPMKKLIQMVRTYYMPNQQQMSGNEYAIIGNAFNVMGEKINHLQTSAKKIEMKNLVLGANLNLEHTGSFPEHTRFIAAYIYMHDGQTTQFQQQYELKHSGQMQEVVCLNAQEAALIYYVASDEDMHAEQQLANELAQFRTAHAGSISFSASIGTIVATSDEIPISYQYAQHAYRYRFIYGKEAIIAYSDITKLEATPYLIAFDQYVNALKAGELEHVNRFLDEFSCRLQSGNRQLEAIELSVLQLVSSLYQAVIDMQLQKIVPPSNLFDEMKKESLEETIQSVRSHSERIVAHVKETSSHAHTDIIMELKQYIDEHLHEDLSLNVLSERASLAPAYISTLFGEVMKESFTEYVTRSRLDKAAQLLQSEPRISVAEISALVGYRNPQYFHNKFKARFGITPVQYRNVSKKASEVQ